MKIVSAFVAIWVNIMWLRYILIAILVLCPWLILIFFAPYGLDLTDEAFYLLSYASPADVTATFSMFHYIGQPLYDLSGGNMAAMRAAGIVLWLVIATATAWTTIGFVARRCGIEPFGRGERGWLTLVGVAGGALYYHRWILTPSYNLFALMGLSLFWLGFLWWVEPRHVDERAWRRYVGAGVFGCAAAIVFWSKATSAAILPLFPLVALAVERRRWRELLSPPTLVWGGVGFVASFGLPVFYGLSISEVVETLRRGVEHQGLMKPADYGSLGGTLAATLRKVSRAMVDMYNQPYPLGSLSFLWVLPLLGAIIGAWWRRQWVVAVLMAGWVANLGVLVWGFREYPGHWLVNLFGITMLYLWVGCILCQSARPCVRRGGVWWVVPLGILAGAFVFGTYSPYFYKLGEGSYFGLLAIAVLFLVLRQNPMAMALRRVGIPALLLSTAFLIYASSLTPYRQADEPVWAMEHHVPIRGGTQTLILGEELAQYVNRIRLMATIGGFEPNTPVIDMTGHTPGAVYVLGGRAYGFPWLIGGYTGSDPAAAYVLSLWEPRHLEDAWILMVGENGRTPLSLSILKEVGLNFPRDYTPVGAVRYPNSSDDFLMTGRSRDTINVHTLWKPKQ
jgi:hypothetical protein